MTSSPFADPRRRRERGAVMTEFAILASLLAVLLAGIVEFGFTWHSKLEVETAARSGARVGSSMGTDRYADYALLQSVKAALTDIGSDNVEYVVVFNASAADGAIPSGCSGGAPSSQNGKCNVYSGAQLATLTQASFGGTSSCSTSSPDRFWCPTSRVGVQKTADYVGVWVKAKRDATTKMFGSKFTMTSKAIMRIEPSGA
jgi:Flp pilus assembly protein TadG